MNIPSGAKARMLLLNWTYGLKPVPFKAAPLQWRKYSRADSEMV
jgi:hypothetical protein